MTDDKKAEYRQLQQTITGEFFRIAGFDPDGVVRKIFGPLLWIPTSRFARLAVDFDYETAKNGINQASGRYLEKYTQGTEASGVENIPKEGPLIITSNHPGTFDAFTILSNTPRQDIKFIISGVPFLRSLPNAAKYFIYTTSDPHGRMNVVRESTRHVQGGGSLLIYPTGILDPDPEILPGAYEALNKWSRSIELVLRRAPEAMVQVSIVSGVLPRSALRNPLLRIVQEDWKKQRLAEFLLVAQHLLGDKHFDLVPKVSFGVPQTVDQLSSDETFTSLTEAIVDQARKQLSAHTNIYPSYETT